MKAVDLLINSALPPDLRDESRRLDKKGIESLLAEVGKRYPERYAGLVKTISDIGRNASYLQGETLTLNDMRPVVDKEGELANLDQEIATAKALSNTPEEFERARMKAWGAFADRMEKATLVGSKATGNNLGNTITSGARGNSFQLKAMITTPALYTDYKDRVIPLLVRHSFGEGLRPAEYLASTFGTRRSVISTKSSTADAGDVGKQLSAAGAHLIVTDDDCGTTNGLDMELDDPDIQGRVLSRSIKGIDAGTVLDKQSISTLRKAGVQKIIVRSPMTCQAKEGICSHCLGTLSDGKFPPIGYAAGITAAHSLTEPITQGSLSSKHCLMEGTLVRMADWSIRSIESIQPGEWVLGSNKEGHTYPVRVKNKYDQGLQIVNRYSFRYGASQEKLTLCATDCHPILANTKTTNCKKDQFNRVIRELIIGTKLHDFGLVLPTEFKSDGIYHEPMAFLIGLLLGDGCYTKSVQGIKLSCADLSLIDFLNSGYLQSHDLIAYLQPGQKIYYGISWTKQRHEQDQKTGRYIKTGALNPVKKWLDKRGMYGKYAHEKLLPPDVHLWDNESIAELLGGLFSADGSVYTNAQGVVAINFASTSFELISGIRDLLAWRFCIYVGPLHCNPPSRCDTARYDLWGFNINRHDQIDRFRKLIPLKGKKAEKIKYLVLKERSDKFFRCIRTQVEPLGLKQCWDLEVESEDRLFVLENGAIVHNTAGGFLGEKKTFGGFSTIENLFQSPESFPNKAAVSTQTGKVESIEDAPQGGKYIAINGEKHYALPGYDVMVKPGDEVEPGDQLSDGVVDVADIVNQRGLGEARRYFVDRLQQAYAETGVGKPRKLNLEMIARATLDHVRINDLDGIGDYLPDDVASYNRLAANYQPAEDTKVLPLQDAKDHYLQVPALHFTVGTKLTPKMLKRLGDAGINQVPVSPQEPKFVPEMQRLRASAHSGTDWLAKLHSSYLSTNIGKDAERGRDTNLEENTNWQPRLAVGTGFGDKIKTTGKF